MGINAYLPLTLDDNDGLKLNQNLETAVRQNLVMLLLTCPGERPMISNFGVGLRNYLFEMDSFQARQELEGKIHEQVGLFMPFVSIEKVEIFPKEISTDHGITILIHYFIQALGTIKVLSFQSDENDFFVFDNALENSDLDV